MATKTPATAEQIENGLKFFAGFFRFVTVLFSVLVGPVVILDLINNGASYWSLVWALLIGWFLIRR